jgi:glycosyltransferase involved in cell wall biosynthesis
MPRRLLLLLSQNPLDPANGAARSMDSISRLLGRDGAYQVEVLGTTATEFADPDAAANLKRQILTRTDLNAVMWQDKDAPLIKFTRDGVRYHLLDSGPCSLSQPHSIHGPRFQRVYQRILDQFRPDILLTYGAMPIERERHREARSRGVAVVLSIHQHAYYDPHAFETADAVHTCSEYLRQCYQQKIGIDSTAISGPLLPEDVAAIQHDPIFVTFVNPSYQKGVIFIARLAEELANRRPDIPLLVIESRYTAGTLISAADAGGFDLRRHPSVMITPPVPMPRDIFSSARLLLAPSLWDEPWGRVAAEALLNGVPPLVSDRGGLPEACNGAGYVFSFPPDLTPQTLLPPPPELVNPWIDVIENLCDDESAYATACRRALDASSAHQPAAVLPRFIEFFDSVRLKNGKKAQR